MTPLFGAFTRFDEAASANVDLDDQAFKHINGSRSPRELCAAVCTVDGQPRCDSTLTGNATQ